jgi:rhodanese-related sulfurtransferase
MLWSAAYASLGFVFSNQLDLVALHLARIGTVIAAGIGIAVGVYLTRKFIRWERFVRQFRLARITPDELHQKLAAGEDILIVDLQGGFRHAANRFAIPGAVRIDPHRLEQYKNVELSPSRAIVLYCASPGEFTSARVAMALRGRGIDDVRPLAGGLRGWRDRGYPVSAFAAAPEPLTTKS